MSTTTTPRKDWTIDSDEEEDGMDELTRQFGTHSPSKSTTTTTTTSPSVVKVKGRGQSKADQVDKEDEEDNLGGEPQQSSSTTDAPVASLLSRILGLSTDPQPSAPSPSTSNQPNQFSSSTPASAAESAQPPAEHSRPRPNTNAGLFGKALAGVQTAPKSPSSSTTAPAQPSGDKPEASKSTENSDKAPAKAEASGSKMTANLMDEPNNWGDAPDPTTISNTTQNAADDDGWGNPIPPATNGNGTTNGENGDHEKADAGTSDSGTGLISNEFEVEVKLADLQADPNNPLYSVKRFEDLPIHDNLMKGIWAAGFKKPSKIQEKALPMLLINPPRNLIGQSQSGTGKTAAFTLNMLSRINPNVMTPQAICLAPSRELARQIQDVVNKIGQFTPMTTFLAVPGSWSRNVKIDKHILIGTPGTILDMLSRRGTIFDPKQIRVLVLDEADELVALQGLGDQTTRIARMLPKDVQRVLFSATFPEEVQNFAETFAPGANKIFLKQEEVTIDTIRQLYLECDGEDTKYDALSALYDCMTIGQSIVFCKRKDTADHIAKRLTDEGHSVASLHGDKQSQDRDAILDGFRDGKTKVLITTNVVARGIDIQQVNLVVNYDVPVMGPEANFAPDIETYIHRIGRTGRFGRKGCSVIFAHDDRSKAEIEEIQNIIGRRMRRIDATSNTDLEQLEKALKAAMKGPVTA